MAMNLGSGYIDLTLRHRQFLTASKLIDAKLKALQLKMQGVAASAKMMLMIGGGVAAGAIKTFADYEKSLAMISTMLDEQSMKYMPEYDRKIRQMAKTFGEGTKTITKGLYDILSASVAVDKALGVLEVSMKAGTAGISTTAVAADAITTILNSYSLAAEKAMSVSDLLFAIIKRGKIIFPELASRIGQVAAVAAIADLSLEQMGAAIATMTRAGLRSRIAITALRAMILTFLKPAEESIKVAQKFGFELNTATLKAIGLTGVLKKLKTATAEELGVLMPNVRGLVGFAAALQNVEAQVSDLDLMLNRAGMTQEAFDKMMNTLSQDLKKLWQSIKMVGIAIGKALQPQVKKLATYLAKVSETIEEWLKANGEFFAQLVKTTAAVLIAIIAFEKFLKVLIALRVIALALVHPLGAITAAVLAASYTGEKLGTELGAAYSKIDEKSKLLKDSTQRLDDLDTAMGVVTKSTKKWKKEQVDLDKFKGTAEERLEKEVRVLRALHQANQDKINLLKARISIAAHTTRGYELIQKEGAAIRKNQAQIVETMRLKRKELELIRMEVIEKTRLMALNKELNQANAEGLERIRELEIAILRTQGDSKAAILTVHLESDKAIKALEERKKIAQEKFKLPASESFEQEEKNIIAIKEAIRKKYYADYAAEEKRNQEFINNRRKSAFKKHLEAMKLIYEKYNTKTILATIVMNERLKGVHLNYQKALETINETELKNKTQLTRFTETYTRAIKKQDKALAELNKRKAITKAKPKLATPKSFERERKAVLATEARNLEKHNKILVELNKKRQIVKTKPALAIAEMFDQEQKAIEEAIRNEPEIRRKALAEIDKRKAIAKAQSGLYVPKSFERERKAVLMIEVNNLKEHNKTLVELGKERQAAKEKSTLALLKMFDQEQKAIEEAIQNESVIRKKALAGIERKEAIVKVKLELEATYAQEALKIDELLQAKLKAIEDKRLKIQLDHRKDLEMDFTRHVKGETAAQLLEIKRYREKFSKIFEGIPEALRMLDQIIFKKMEQILDVSNKEIRMSIVSPREMWRHLATSLNQRGGEDTQKQLLSEFIDESNRSTRSDSEAHRQRERMMNFLQQIALTEVSGALRR